MLSAKLLEDSRLKLLLSPKRRKDLLVAHAFVVVDIDELFEIVRDDVVRRLPAGLFLWLSRRPSLWLLQTLLDFVLLRHSVSYGWSRYLLADNHVHENLVFIDFNTFGRARFFFVDADAALVGYEFKVT